MRFVYEQAYPDKIRVMNKIVTNKLLIHISGKRFYHFMVLSHMGRMSAKLYQIPVITEPVDKGFDITLRYGKKVNWYENDRALGGCQLRWNNKAYRLVNPKFMDKILEFQLFRQSSSQV